MNEHVPNPLLRFFATEHLRPELKAASEPFCKLATYVDEKFPNGAEKTTCLRKLLEAKDCAVRAVVADKVI